MRTVRYIVALGAFFVLVVGLAACGSGVPGNAVADVEGNPITTTAFNHWMYVAAKTEAVQNPGAPVVVPTDPPDFNGCIRQVRAISKTDPTLASLASASKSMLRKDCSQLFTALSSQVMGLLITAYWYQAEAAREHFSVSAAQVLQEFTTAKQQNFHSEAEFQNFLNQTGQTTQDILFRLRVNQAFMKLLAKHNTTVSSAQVQSYYRTHMSQFGTPESRDIRLVLTKSKGQALAAKAALSTGQSWNAVVKKYSADPTTKNAGGLLTGVSKGQQDATLDNAAFAAPANKVMGPLQSSYGFYVFEVTRVRKGTQQSLAQATPLIRQTLTRQAQSNAQSAVQAVVRKHWLRQTACRQQYAMSDCNGYKAPKSATRSRSSSR